MSAVSVIFCNLWNQNLQPLVPSQNQDNSGAILIVKFLIRAFPYKSRTLSIDHHLQAPDLHELIMSTPLSFHIQSRSISLYQKKYLIMY